MSKTIPLDQLATVTGGAFYVDGKCIAGCPDGTHQHAPAGNGITADELWADQLKKKRRW
jgi:hypothetical protein